ncbi:Transcription factor E2FA [Vitis vinifera]|uniref:Transcription factor E2FA n=1 Tax=Vitis vinifera TaxID=29760 RepID=A0A438CC44_VITVI|nr:Transcription factor E2FA [Vitis vinifera]
MKRHLPFTSTKPPFVPPDDYHRFSSADAHGVANHEPEGIVVKSPQLKRKSAMDDNEVGSSEWTASPGYADAGNSPFRTPVSGKGGRIYSKSKVSKGNVCGPQTPVSNAGSPSTLTPAGNCRYDSSLEDGILDLNKAAETLEGLDVSRPGEVDDDVTILQEKLRDLSEDENNQKWLFVTEDDIKGLPCFQNETLIAIKAPHGTTLEVPDPDEAVDYPQRRYRIVLRSTMGPIDVYLVSFPLASSSGSNENPSTEVVIADSSGKELEPQDGYQMCSDLTASQEFIGGIMKIVPDVDSDADYWLRSDAEVSITDMWKTDSYVEWNGVDMLNAEFGMADVSTPLPQTPPSGLTEGRLLLLTLHIVLELGVEDTIGLANNASCRGWMVSWRNMAADNGMTIAMCAANT